MAARTRTQPDTAPAADERPAEAATPAPADVQSETTTLTETPAQPAVPTPSVVDEHPVPSTHVEVHGERYLRSDAVRLGFIEPDEAPAAE